MSVWLPVLAFVCGALGLLFSSTPMVVVAVLLAGAIVVRSVATIGSPGFVRLRPRSRRRSGRLR